MAEETGKEEPKATPKPDGPGGYTQRLGEATRWALTALAAAGTFAVGKLSLDRFGDGEYDATNTFLAFCGIWLFTVGVAVLVMAVMWVSRASRVTVAYLQSTRRLPTLLRRKLENTSYLMNGAESLDAFVDSLNAAVRERAVDPRVYEADPDKKAHLDVLLSARTALLSTARAERVAKVNLRAAFLLVGGSVAAATGAAMFGFITNQAERDAAQLPAGELVPPAAQELVVAFPDDETIRPEIAALLGSSCGLDAVAAVAVEVASPPAPTDPTRVVHVFTTRADTCAGRELWISPDWIAPTPEPAAKTDD